MHKIILDSLTCCYNKAIIRDIDRCMNLCVCMYVCIYIYIYIYTHTHKHTNEPRYHDQWHDKSDSYCASEVYKGVNQHHVLFWWVDCYNYRPKKDLNKFDKSRIVIVRKLGQSIPWIFKEYSDLIFWLMWSSLVSIYWQWSKKNTNCWQGFGQPRLIDIRTGHWFSLNINLLWHKLLISLNLDERRIVSSIHSTLILQEFYLNRLHPKTMTDFSVMENQNISILLR